MQRIIFLKCYIITILVRSDRLLGTKRQNNENTVNATFACTNTNVVCHGILKLSQRISPPVRKAWAATLENVPLDELLANTVDSRYLEFQGTHWNTSEKSVPRHIRVERVRKTKYWTTTFNKWICNLTPEVRNIIYKIMWKRGEIAPQEQFLLFSTLFCYLLS